MANRFPLIVNSSVNAIQELAAGDNLDLTSSGISNVGDINSVGFSTLNAISANSLRITGVSTVGVVTGATSIQATVFYGSGSGLTGVASTDNIQTGTPARFLSNVNVSGFSTLGAASATLLSVSGVSTFSSDVTIGGNLTVNGTTTTINSTTITVDDKNIELASTVSPSDAAADGGGITLKGTTDKTFNWVNATAAWTSSEDLNLLTGKQYEINGVSVLTSTTLGSGVVNSSLTSVGTLSGLSVTGGINGSQGADLARLRVTGITTLGQTNTTGLSNAGISTLGNATSATLNVSGFSTFSGGLSVTSGGANISGVVTATTFSGSLAVGNITGLGANVATFLATPSSANLASAVSDETGTGALVFANSPTLVSPALGTPSSGTLTNCTGYTVGNISGLGANVATFLATPTSSNLASAISDETGSGSLVFANTPTFTGGINASEGADLGRLRVTGIATHGQTTTVGLSNAGISTLGNATASTLVITGFSTLGSVNASNLILAGITTGINAPGISTLGSITNTNISVSGISTFSGGVNAPQGIDISTNGIRVVGLTTLATTSIGNVTSVATLNVTGFSTISGGLSVPLITSSGIATFLGTVELGHASDTTLSRASAGRLAVEGVNVVTVSSSDTLTNKTLTSPVLNSPTITDVVSATTLRVTGFSTFSGGSSSTLFRSVGISTLDNTTATTLVVSGVSTVGVVTGATSIQATRFYGDGSALTGLGGASQWTNVSSGIHTTSNVGIATTNPISVLTIGSQLGIDTSTTTVATTTATSIIGIATATFRSAKIQVQITQGSSHQASDILLIHNGVTSNIIEYGTLATDSLLGSFTTDINSNNARLLVTMSSATSATIKAVAHKMTI